MKQNLKLQKQKDEHERINIVYQKRYLSCTCTCRNASSAEVSDSQPAAVPKSINENQEEEIHLTLTQNALLGRHINPSLKLGLLVGDLAVMIFAEEELQTKTAASLNREKFLFMMGKFANIQ